MASGGEFAYRSRTVTRRIIVHGTHWDIPNASARMLTHGRAMGLLSVGVHYVVERDGRVVRHTPEHCIGAHCAGHNWDSVGIAAVEDEEGHTPEMMESLVQLLIYVAGNYEPRPVILGDSEVRRNHQPKCPAFDMAALRARINMENILPPESFSAQHRTIIETLKSGRSLTPKIAIIELGIGSLTSRIAELRALGHPIKGEWRQDTHGKRYMKYRLEEETR